MEETKEMNEKMKKELEKIEAIKQKILNYNYDRIPITKYEKEMYDEQMSKHKENISNMRSGVLNSLEEILVDFFQLVHLDKERPENHSMYVTNLRKEMVFYIMQNTWMRLGTIKTLEDKAQVLYDIFNNLLVQIIDQETDAEKKMFYVKSKENINNYWKDNGQFKEELAKRYFELLYANRDMLKSTFEATRLKEKFDKQVEMIPTKKRIQLRRRPKKDNK